MPYSKGVRKWISKAISHPGEAHLLIHTPLDKKVSLVKIREKLKQLKERQKHTKAKAQKKKITHEERALNLAKTLKRISEG